MVCKPYVALSHKLQPDASPLDMSTKKVIVAFTIDGIAKSHRLHSKSQP